jgi:hypothetical protein
LKTSTEEQEQQKSYTKEMYHPTENSSISGGKQ